MQQPSIPYTPSQYIRTQVAIHLGFLLAISSLAMFGIAYIDIWELSYNYTEDPFVLVVPMFAIIGVAVSNFMFRKQLDILKKTASFKEKLGGYQTAVLIKYAILEAPALFSLVLFINTENLLFLIIGVVMLFYLFMQRPTKEKLINDLYLNGEMRASFRRGDLIVE